MDDDDYYDMVMSKSSNVVMHSWEDCIHGFKQADVDMGSAFHRKLEWMDKSADAYLYENNKNAGFLGKFADDCGISYEYAKQLNRVRKVGCNPQNFSSDAFKALLSAPRELRDDIVSSDKPVTVAEVQQAKAGYKEVKENPDYGDILEDVKEKRKTPVEAAREVNKRVEEAVLEFNSLSNEQKIERLGTPFVIDQAKLDNTLEEDFNPINAATGILISLNRLRLFGGKKEIERNILGVLENTVRMQSYEAEALILLADVVNENRISIESLYQTKPNLKSIN